MAAAARATVRASAAARLGMVSDMARLRRLDLAGRGIRRRRRGRGWSYVDAEGVVLDDPVERTRIDALAIPPAWRDVWICPWANGHIQACGTDAADLDATGAGRRATETRQWGCAAGEHQDSGPGLARERLRRTLGPHLRTVRTECLD